MPESSHQVHERPADRRESLLKIDREFHTHRDSTQQNQRAANHPRPANARFKLAAKLSQLMEFGLRAPRGIPAEPDGNRERPANGDEFLETERGAPGVRPQDRERSQPRRPNQSALPSSQPPWLIVRRDLAPLSDAFDAARVFLQTHLFNYRRCAFSQIEDSKRSRVHRAVITDLMNLIEIRFLVRFDQPVGLGHDGNSA